MTGPYLAALKSWWWRKRHPAEAVGFERPQSLANTGTLTERLLFVNHLLPVMDATKKARRT